MNFSFLPQFWSYFNYGVLVTIMISVCVVFFGTILGVLVSLAKRSGIKPLEWLVSLYVWVFRGTPMVVQIMIAFNLIHMNLPTVQFGILNLDLSRIVPGIIVLSLNSGAYISESVRAGIESIPKGQIEAAYSLGIRPWNTMRIIILPQAVHTILPPLTNQVVNLIKNTSTVAIISGADIMFTAKAWAYDTTNYVPAFAGAAFLYFIMCFPLATWARRKEEQNKKAY